MSQKEKGKAPPSPNPAMAFDPAHLLGMHSMAAAAGLSPYGPMAHFPSPYSLLGQPPGFPAAAMFGGLNLNPMANPLHAAALSHSLAAASLYGLPQHSGDLVGSPPPPPPLIPTSSTSSSSSAPTKSSSSSSNSKRSKSSKTSTTAAASSPSSSPLLHSSIPSSSVTTPPTFAVPFDPMTPFLPGWALNGSAYQMTQLANQMAEAHKHTQHLSANHLTESQYYRSSQPSSSSSSPSTSRSSKSRSKSSTSNSRRNTSPSHSHQDSKNSSHHRSSPSQSPMLNIPSTDSKKHSSSSSKLQPYGPDGLGFDPRAMITPYEMSPELAYLSQSLLLHRPDLAALPSSFLAASASAAAAASTSSSSGGAKPPLAHSSSSMLSSLSSSSSLEPGQLSSLSSSSSKKKKKRDSSVESDRHQSKESCRSGSEDRKNSLMSNGVKGTDNVKATDGRKEINGSSRHKSHHGTASPGDTTTTGNLPNLPFDLSQASSSEHSMDNLRKKKIADQIRKRMGGGGGQDQHFQAGDSERGEDPQDYSNHPSSGLDVFSSSSPHHHSQYGLRQSDWLDYLSNERSRLGKDDSGRGRKNSSSSDGKDWHKEQSHSAMSLEASLLQQEEQLKELQKKYAMATSGLQDSELPETDVTSHSEATTSEHDGGPDDDSLLSGSESGGSDRDTPKRGTDSNDDGSPAKKRCYQTDERELVIPLEHGWNRQTVISGMGRRGIVGDVYYYAPCGKKLKTIPDITRYLERNPNGDLARENFSFNTKVNVGQFYEVRGGDPTTPVPLTDTEVLERIEMSRGKRARLQMLAKKKREKVAQEQAMARHIMENKLKRKLELQDMSRRASEFRVEKKLEKQKQKEMEKKLKEDKALEKLKEKEHHRIQKQQERVRLQEQIRKEREMRAQQIIDARNRRQQELEEMRHAETVKRNQERELKRQQLIMLKEQERERRRQHILLLKAIEQRKKQEEKQNKERLKEEKLNEKLKLREIRMEQRKVEMDVAIELKKPVEDMELKNRKSLPEFPRLESRLAGRPIADCLMVVEFLTNFGAALNLEKSSIPSLETLEKGLMGDTEEEVEEVMSLVMHLLRFALDDVGVPNPKEAMTKLNQKVTEMEMTDSTMSEILRIFIKARGDEKMSEWLREKPMEALNPTQKAAILAFLCNELLTSKVISSEIDKHMDSINNLRRDKWIVEGQLRQLRVFQAKKFNKIHRTTMDRRHVNSSNSNSSNNNSSGNGGGGDEDTRSSSGGKLGGGGSDEEEEDKEEEEEGSGNESDGSTSVPMTSVSSSAASNMLEPIDESLTREESDKRIENLRKQHLSYRQKVFRSSLRLRAINIGQDRYKRTYWILPMTGGVYLEGMESGEPDDYTEENDRQRMKKEQKDKLDKEEGVETESLERDMKKEMEEAAEDGDPESGGDGELKKEYVVKGEKEDVEMDTLDESTGAESGKMDGRDDKDMVEEDDSGMSVSCQKANNEKNNDDDDDDVCDESHVEDDYDNNDDHEMSNITSISENDTSWMEESDGDELKSGSCNATKLTIDRTESSITDSQADVSDCNDMLPNQHCQAIGKEEEAAKEKEIGTLLSSSSSHLSGKAEEVGRIALLVDNAATPPISLEAGRPGEAVNGSHAESHSVSSDSSVTKSDASCAKDITETTKPAQGPSDLSMPTKVVIGADDELQGVCNEKRAVDVCQMNGFVEDEKCEGSKTDSSTGSHCVTGKTDKFSVDTSTSSSVVDGEKAGVESVVQKDGDKLNRGELSVCVDLSTPRDTVPSSKMDIESDTATSAISPAASMGKALPTSDILRVPRDSLFALLNSSITNAYSTKTDGKDEESAPITTSPVLPGKTKTTPGAGTDKDTKNLMKSSNDTAVVSSILSSSLLFSPSSLIPSSSSSSSSLATATTSASRPKGDVHPLSSSLSPAALVSQPLSAHSRNTKRQSSGDQDAFPRPAHSKQVNRQSLPPFHPSAQTNPCLSRTPPAAHSSYPRNKDSIHQLPMDTPPRPNLVNYHQTSPPSFNNPALPLNLYGDSSASLALSSLASFVSPPPAHQNHAYLTSSPKLLTTTTSATNTTSATSSTSSSATFKTPPPFSIIDAVLKNEPEYSSSQLLHHAASQVRRGGEKDLAISPQKSQHSPKLTSAELSSMVSTASTSPSPSVASSLDLTDAEITSQHPMWFSLLPRSPCDELSLTRRTSNSTTGPTATSSAANSLSLSSASLLLHSSPSTSSSLTPLASSLLNISSASLEQLLNLIQTSPTLLSQETLRQSIQFLSSNSAPSSPSPSPTPDTDFKVPQPPMTPMALNYDPWDLLRAAQGEQQPIPANKQHGWWRIYDLGLLKKVMTSCMNRGIREHNLQRAIHRYLDYAKLHTTHDTSLDEVDPNQDTSSSNKTSTDLKRKSPADRSPTVSPVKREKKDPEQEPDVTMTQQDGYGGEDAGKEPESSNKSEKMSEGGEEVERKTEGTDEQAMVGKDLETETNSQSELKEEKMEEDEIKKEEGGEKEEEEEEVPDFVTPDTEDGWWSVPVMHEIEMAAVEDVEALEDRIYHASLQAKSGWKPNKDIGLKMVDRAVSEVKDDESYPLDAGIARLLELEANIERRYLKPPLSRSVSLNMSNLASSSNSTDRQDSVGSSSDLEKEEDIPPGLLLWRQAVVGSESPAQLSLCTQLLSKSIWWEKSIMRVICQNCRKDDNEAELLLCDGCDKGFHTYCFKPKMENIPDGDWYCFECVSKASGTPHCGLCGAKGGRLAHCSKCPRYVHLDCLDPPLPRVPKRWHCANCIYDKGSSSKRSRKRKESLPTVQRITKLVVKEEPADGDEFYPTMEDNPSNSSTTPPQACGGGKDEAPPKTHDVKPDPDPLPSLTISLAGSASPPNDNKKKRQRRKKEKTPNPPTPPHAPATPPAVTTPPPQTSTPLSSPSSSPKKKRPRKDRKGKKDESVDVQKDKEESDAGVGALLGERDRAKDITACVKLLGELERHEAGWPFLKSVSHKQFPSYKKYIKEPMDFTTIKNRLKAKSYHHYPEFARDVRLVFDNCETFNEDDSEVGQAGHTLRQVFEARWLTLFPEDNQQ